MGRVLLGTCSWNYDSWEGLVYSKRQRTAAEYLIEYSRKYKTVEIDSWFYKIPQKTEAETYFKNTPEDFMFTCKVFQNLTLTHERSRSRDLTGNENKQFLSTDLFNDFCEAVNPLLPKIDLFMFEFEYLNKQKMESVDKFIDLFNDFKSKIDKKYRIGIEIRNGNYLTETYFKFLKENSIIHVFSEKQYMPHVYDVFEKYHSYLGDTAVFRLLGGDRREMENKTKQVWDRIVDEKRDKERIINLIAKPPFNNGKVIINVNNHYEGSAPLTIEKIREICKNLGVEE